MQCVCEHNSTLICLVAEIHDDLVKAKLESRKERLPPRAPKDKPTVVEVQDDILQLVLSALFFS